MSLRDGSITVDENISTGMSEVCLEVHMALGYTLEYNLTATIGAVPDVACMFYNIRIVGSI